MAKGGSSVANNVRQLLEGEINSLGYEIWDVEYVKEGATWYLRITIDSENGIDINDCEKVHRAIDPILDDADPIQDAYYLEVSSPGVERELTRETHFEACKGEKIMVKFIRAVDGVREFKGVLEDFDGKLITLRLEDGNAMSFEKKETSYIKLDDFSF